MISLSTVSIIGYILKNYFSRGHQVQPPMDRIMIDPFNSTSNQNVCLKRYRFSNDNTRNITEMIRTIFYTNRNRGAPSTPEQIV